MTEEDREEWCATETGGPILDERDRAILQRIAAGLTWRQVARDLGMSEATTQRALQRIRSQLGANSTINAVHIATKQELI